MKTLDIDRSNEPSLVEVVSKETGEIVHSAGPFVGPGLDAEIAAVEDVIDAGRFFFRVVPAVAGRC